MQRLYTVVFQNVAVAASQDLFELTPAAQKPVKLVGLSMGQSSQEGDSLEDYFRWSVIRGHSTGGSGGTAPTPRPLDRSGTAAGFAAEVNNTTIASAGSPIILHADTFNIRSGLMFWWPEFVMPEASLTDTTIVVRLESTPDASTTCDGTLYVVEYG